MNIIVENSIKRISSYLEGFRRANGQYNFRCPYCGDSAKSKLKKRGWLFDYNGNCFYKCFNCDKSTSYSSFLKDWFPDEYRRYISDKALLEPNSPSREKTSYTPTILINRDGFSHLPGVYPTTENNPAARYLDKRKISNRDSFFYTNDYGRLLQQLELDEYKNDFSRHEPRLLIPHFNRAGNLSFVQTRALDNSKLRYQTYKVIEGEYKLWNLDRINLNRRIYVTEGALDGSFIQNCVAMSGSDAQLEKSILGEVKENLRLILDNEPYSPIILQKYERLIQNGYKVFHWPDVHKKDINDCILAGIDIAKYIYNDENYFNGMLGLLDFYKWKKY